MCVSMFVCVCAHLGFRMFSVEKVLYFVIKVFLISPFESIAIRSITERGHFGGGAAPPIFCQPKFFLKVQK